MAAGLRDLLALQGVIPLNAVVATSTAGLTVGQASGVWVTGATTGTTTTPGLTLNQSSGVWITGGDSTPVVVTAGLTLNQLMGVWVSASTNTPVVVTDTGGGGSKLALLLREDQEIVDIITALGPLLVRL